MNEHKNETADQYINETKEALPTGEVILGDIDPTTLSKEDFSASPELLFHGAGKPFPFSQDYDYQQHMGPNSVTVGNGLYLTPNKEDARLFSQAFGAKLGEEVIYEFLPHQARMYDFRSINQQDKNALVPKELFQEYLQFVTKLIEEMYPDENAKSDFFYNENMNYLKILQAQASNPSVNLRQMLSSDVRSEHGGFGANYFAEFMKKKGFDGVIYIEGGDHREHKDPVSYVFYNPKKIGTFETWHTREQLS